MAGTRGLRGPGPEGPPLPRAESRGGAAVAAWTAYLFTCDVCSTSPWQPFHLSGVTRVPRFQTSPGQGLLRGGRFSSYSGPLCRDAPLLSVVGGSSYIHSSNLPLSIAPPLRNGNTHHRNFQDFPSLPILLAWTSFNHWSPPFLKLSGLSLLITRVKIHFSLSPSPLDSLGPAI